jgi:osmotically-inducible protein OsmY
LLLKFNFSLEMIMSLSKNVFLCGSALMALSGYGVAAPVDDANQRAPEKSQAVVVTGMDERGSDSWVRAEVQRRINERPSLRSFNIVVYTDHQDVYLQGVVDTTLDRELGDAIARTVPSVRNVYNGLAVFGA